MRENYERLVDFEAVSTHKTINSEATVILGLTAKDIATGLLVFLFVAPLPSFYASFVALALAVISVFTSRNLRRDLAPRFFAHFFWSAGIVDFDPVRRSLWTRALSFLRAFGFTFVP
jgi:hypothetical protein